ncbi:hypothetical protein [Halomonas urumqiensis]|uniref:Sulfotransferase family protein n=1 Tax=Halomonas urumqiensis TaxID=1684789 RepID=A0A2N7UCH4_9GAMM|nr:hypothetical protein [Halomonas urumqiensis]PMR78146.1 hypothetical protein C1H70_15330 [Halomonas urumqiensis]PTB03295.1 hypothetical protein C6V82_01965 [Halomonas urumqiensis]GHE20543.1 hypothetical protein GCM10017767_10640 [Halomonas urumqiensis]
MPEVLLHIGAPKSGTSAIQRFCQLNRGWLEQQGYFYPEHTLDVNGVSGGHTQLAGRLINGERDAAAHWFNEQLGHARRQKACLLLSAEGLYGREAEMSAITKGLRVRIVAFLRAPIDYLLSNHNQGIKRHMGTQRLIDAASGMLRLPVEPLVGVPFLRWADAFGDEQCVFLPYQSPLEGGEPIEGVFLRQLGITDVKVLGKVEAAGITNRSYVRSALEIKRLLNTVLPELADEVAYRVDWSLQGYSDRATEQRGHTVNDLPATLRAELQAHLYIKMAPVIERFPVLTPLIAECDAATNLEPFVGLDLYAPLQALVRDYPDVVEQIRDKACELRDTGKSGYTFLKLLDLLGIEFNESPTIRDPLTDSGRRTLSSHTAKDADYLRELALCLERLGYMNDALLVADQALSKRPNGVGIQKIRQRIIDRVATADGQYPRTELK